MIACRSFWRPKIGRAWLGEKQADPEQLKSLLAPYPAADMVIWPVDKRVGDPWNKDPSRITSRGSFPEL
jgi:putative SOS response-associated peptidase YedK